MESCERLGPGRPQFIAQVLTLDSMASGGSDGSIKIWDLEACPNPHRPYIYRPVASVPRVRDEHRREGHTSGLTHLDFHPFNRDTLLSSSFDHSLKQWSCASASVAAHFDLQAKIYSHATSPVSSVPVVACATQHSNVRLADLRSRSTAQSLSATAGPVLSVSWSPRHERVLASGHADGSVRLWDARRGHAPLGLLNMEDSLGIVHRFNHAMSSGLGWTRGAVRLSARAHGDAVNGLTWTDDGNYIVSAGLDGRIRVWDAATGANTLAGFGSAVQNRRVAPLRMIVPPSSLTAAGSSELLFWPNEHEILVMDLHEGYLMKRLRVPDAAVSAAAPGGAPRKRITGMAWRGAGGRKRLLGVEVGGGNAPGGIYTCHADGYIRAWMPRISEPDEPEEEDVEGRGVDDETKKRKRKAVDDAFRSLMGQQVTFT